MGRLLLLIGNSEDIGAKFIQTRARQFVSGRQKRLSSQNHIIFVNCHNRPFCQNGDCRFWRTHAGVSNCVSTSGDYIYSPSPTTRNCSVSFFYYTIECTIICTLESHWERLNCDGNQDQRQGINNATLSNGRVYATASDHNGQKNEIKRPSGQDWRRIKPSDCRIVRRWRYNVIYYMYRALSTQSVPYP